MSEPAANPPVERSASPRASASAREKPGLRSHRNELAGEFGDLGTALYYLKRGEKLRLGHE